MAIIIFDLGGVILDIDLQRAKHAFARAAGKDLESKFAEFWNSGVLKEYETGKVTSAQFRETIKNHTSIQLSESEFDKCWNEILIQIPINRVNALKTLAKRHDLHLLSNTNEIHINWVDAYVAKNFGLKLISDLFRETFYSYKLGLRKPDKEIYSHVVKKLEARPTDCIFIDDYEPNVKGAKALGLDAHQLKAGVEFMDLLKSLGVR